MKFRVHGNVDTASSELMYIIFPNSLTRYQQRYVTGGRKNYLDYGIPDKISRTKCSLIWTLSSADYK